MHVLRHETDIFYRDVARENTADQFQSSMFWAMKGTYLTVFSKEKRGESCSRHVCSALGDSCMRPSLATEDMTNRLLLIHHVLLRMKSTRFLVARKNMVFEFVPFMNRTTRVLYLTPFGQREDVKMIVSHI